MCVMTKASIQAEGNSQWVHAAGVKANIINIYKTTCSRFSYKYFFFMYVCCFLLNFLLRILPRLPSIFVVDDLPHCGSLLLAHVRGMRFDSSLDKLFLCINNVNRCYTDRKLTIPIHFTLKYITFRPTAWHSIKLHSISIFVYLDDVFQFIQLLLLCTHITNDLISWNNLQIFTMQILLLS